MKKITHKIKESFSKGFWTGTGFAVAILTTSLIAVAVTIPKTWKSGDLLTSADMNANFEALKTAVEGIGGQIIITSGAVTETSSFTTPIYAGFSNVLSTMATVETAVQYPFLRTAVVKNLRVTINGTPSNSANVIITIRKNGADTPVTLTIPPSVVTGNVFTSPVGSTAVFNTNDLFSIGQSYGSVPATSGSLNFVLEYEVQ